MKRSLLIVLFVLAATATTVLAEWATVDRVIDGDTFVISGGTRIRVRDIDTPETHHPTKGLERGGLEATALAKFLLHDNYVWLDGASNDKYGRRVAKVWLPGGAWYADVIRSYGYDKHAGKIYRATPSPKGKQTKRQYLQENPHHYAKMKWAERHWTTDGMFQPGGWVFPASRAPASTPASLPPAMPASSGGSSFTATATSPMAVSSSRASSTSSGGTVYVRGYYRNSGTYVAPHTRSAPRR